MNDAELVLGTQIEDGQAVVLSGVWAAMHRLIVGVTGAGKSKFLASLFVQLLNQGVGCLLLDPAGDLCDDILRVLLDCGFFTDKRSFRRLLYLDFTRSDAFVPMNVLSQPYPPHQIAASVLEAFKRSWSSLAGGSAPALESFALYGSLVLTLNQESLTKLPALLTNPGYRSELLANVKDEIALEFFEWFTATGGRGNMLTESTLRRIMLLSFQPSLRYALSQQRNVLRMRELMDQNVSVLVNLGGLDPEVQSFLGCLISTAVEEAALSRADLPEDKRTPYHFIMDEFSQFSSRSATGLERILSLTRKMGLSLTLGCQVFAQIPSDLRATLGQTTFIGFKLARVDASWGAELVTTVNRERVKYTATGHPTFMSSSEQRAEWEDTLSSLPPRQAVLRVGDQTIRFHTLSIPQARSSQDALQHLKNQYAQLYLTPRSQLEASQSLGADRQTPDREQSEAPGMKQKRSRARRFTPLG
jgi:uncharacterized protein DUF87